MHQRKANRMWGYDYTLDNSEIMGAFKTTVSKQIHLVGYSEFQWQRSFYDHIISDEKSYHNISRYIQENPIKWKEDKFYNSQA